MKSDPPSPSIVFFGTSEFAVRPLRALAENFSVIAVVTTPDKPAGRKNELSPSPIKLFAKKLGIPILQPPSLKAGDLKLKIPIADIYIVCAYGKIIPKDIIDMPLHGSINIHPSLLPRWRGPSPVQAALLADDKKTGVTLIQMDEKMDHGPIIDQKEFTVQSETATELLEILSEISAHMITDTVPRWIKGNHAAHTQNETEATYCKIIKKEDGLIDWKRPAADIERHIRAFAGWPGSFTIWNRRGKPFRLRVTKAREQSASASHEDAPGTARVSDGTLHITTGNGIIEVLEIQPEGKNPMPASNFLNGYADIEGVIFS